ncbi:hypothetical protein [uncultured Ferrimonas sp.]|uniref:hypothetical protein n=1 Tax=uncultured Ferrimonas sp. TaxID=432640 RepID=UPI002613F3FA|nr:hypothetical protein [uncultured Ferrimonas sp.]
MTEQWMGEVIEGAFDAAVDGSWYQWLDFLRHSMGASGGMLAHLGQPSALPIACGSDICGTAVNRYLTHRRQDPWYCLANSQPNQVTVLDGPMRLRRAHSDVADLCQQLQSHFHTGSVLSSDTGNILLTLHRGPDQCDFDPKQLQALSQVIGHLRSALAITPLLFERVQQRLSAAQLADQQHPQAVVRANGIPAFVNDRMRDYLQRQRHPFQYHQGRLGSSFPMLTRLIDQAQRRACSSYQRTSRVPLGDGLLQVTPLPESVLADAALWHISPNS